MDFQMWWMLFLWALSSTDRLTEGTEDTTTISDSVGEYEKILSVFHFLTIIQQ